MIRYAKFITLLFCMLFICACAKTKNIYVQPPEVQRRVLIQFFAEDLANVGAQLILIGETVRIIFPDQTFFTTCSANLSPNNLYILNATASVMRKLETISVKISGYTNCKSSYTLNKSLSKQQAEVLAEYLWTRGLDARLVSTMGYGTQDPIMMNENAFANRRVEIYFQYLPLLR